MPEVLKRSFACSPFHGFDRMHRFLKTTPSIECKMLLEPKPYIRFVKTSLISVRLCGFAGGHLCGALYVKVVAK